MSQKTKNISNYIDSLCKSDYTMHEVDTVIDYFFHKTKYQIKYKQFLFNEWLETEEEIRDICYDFIAPLFARDTNGVFYRLKEYFHDKQTYNTKEFDIEITKLIRSVIKQESVLIYASRDPFGKVFYESIQYLLKKHDDWFKIKTPNNGRVIYGTDVINVVKVDLMRNIFHRNKSDSLTKSIDSCLTVLIDKNYLSVPIIDLLTIVKETGFQYKSDKSNFEDPTLESSISIIMDKTLAEIEDSILDGYIKKGILDKTEYSVLQSAAREVIRDFSNGGTNQSYYEYLKKYSKQGFTKELYQKKYKTRFEYVAKVAKKLFSANTKIEFKL